MISTVQTQPDYANASGASRQTTFAIPVRPGHAVKVNVFWKADVTITSVTDTAGNTYADSGAGRLARPVDGYLQCYGAKNVTGGVLTITVAFSGSATNINILLEELLGVDATTMFGATATGTATSGTAATTGTFTPSYTSGAILVWGVSDVAALCSEGTIGGISAVRSDFSGNGFGAEQLAYRASLGSNITASMNFGGTVTKAAVLAVEIKAAAEVYASEVVLGLNSGGFFTFSGRRVFLVGPTYFDALDWWLSDLVSFRDQRYTVLRCLLDKPWDDGGTGTESIFNSDGTIRPERAARIHALIRTAASYGMVVELVLHVADGTPNTASWITNATNRASAVTNSVAEFKAHTNVLWDLVNEFNYGTAYDNVATELQPLIDAALTEDPDGLFCASGAGSIQGQEWGLAEADDTIITADVDALEGTGVPIFAIHCGRQVDWYARTGSRTTTLKNYLAGTLSRPDMPIYLNEEARRGSIFGGGADPTGQQFKTSVLNAYQAGAGGIILHSDATFNLRTATGVSQFDSEETIGMALCGVAVSPDGPRVSTARFPKPKMRR